VVVVVMVMVVVVVMVMVMVMVVVVVVVVVVNRSEGFLHRPERHLDHCCSIVSPRRSTRLRDQAKPCVSH
jgi:hypothetical protein